VRAHQRLEERVGNQVDVEALEARLEVEEQLLKWPRPEDAASD